MNKIRRPSSLGVLVLMALVLVAFPAVPATAEHAPAPGPVVSGSGNLEGTEVADDSAFTGTGICLQANTIIFGLRGDGTYSGRSTDGGEVIYRAELPSGQTRFGDGPIQLEIQNTEPYYHGPYGTHGTTDRNCTPSTAGSPISAEFRLFAPDHLYRLDGAGTQVPCVGQGTFARGEFNSTYFGNPYWRADWTLAEDCTVVGNDAGTPGSGVTPAGTAMQQHGSHGPCFAPPCVDNLKTDYKQYAPVPGPYLALSGPASADTGENATIVARLTNDGAPVAGVPVTFSATGPGAAVPPGLVAVTAADGTASFAFTALDAGDYTATATATYNAQVLSASHTVAFRPPPPLNVELSAPPSAQTEEDTKFVALVTDGGDPTPAADVQFSVTGPAPATPPSAATTTDTNGQASFVFRADRAGDYTVTATASRLGEQASATKSVHLDINTFSVAGSIPSEPGRNGSAVIDPAGDYAYFGGAGQVEKVDLRTFQRVGVMSTAPLGVVGELGSAVMDPAGKYAYFGETTSIPQHVVKVDLATFQPLGKVTLPNGELSLSAAVIDPAGRYAYFATKTQPARIVKIDLDTFQRVGAIVLPSGENDIQSAVMDPAGNYAYFGARGGGTSGALVVKVDLKSFQRAGAVTVTEPYQPELTSAVIDADGRFGYFGTGAGTNQSVYSPGQVVKVDLAALQPVGAVTLVGDERDLTAAVIDPGGTFAYFGANPRSGGSAPLVVKIDLRTFRRAHAISVPTDEFGEMQSAVIDPTGNFAYFKKDDVTVYLPFRPVEEVPAKIYKVALTRAPNPALAVADDAYATDYLTPLEVPAPGVLANDGPGLVAGQASDPPGGSVELRPDGSFTYTPDQGFSGTDTFTYTATNGRDYSAPATVSIAVGAAPEGVSSVSGGALGYYTNVSLFGGAFETRGPDPSVTLPATGSPQPRAAFSPSGSAVYGPATIFESGPLVVSTGGTTGPGGSSASSASAKAVGPGPLFADSMASTCRSTETGSSGSTTLSGARVRVSMGNDFDSEADDKVVVVPDNPAPNTEVRGAIENVGDSFRVVFNEQVPSPDAITVNAAHMYLEGPTAVGEAIIGQSRCGVVAQAPNTAPSATDDAYTTATGTPLQVSPAGVLANDTDPEADPLTAAKVVPAFPSSPNAGWSFPSDPANGSLTLGPDGSFTYTPNDGFVGTDTFAYRASDPRGAGDEGTVTVTVAPSTTSTTSTTTPTSTTSTTTPTSTTSTTVPPTSKIAPVADFDGDGTTDESIYRPSTGQWFVQGGQVTSWGTADDIPVPGDYDANATTDIAIYRPGTGQWFIQGTTPSVTSWGEAGDIPVPGDYDGNGATDIAIYRPSTGQWFVRGGPVTSWGADGDIPVPGDYDGNGTTDIAIYRPSTGQWFVQGGQVTSWGADGDIPVPGDYDGNGFTDIAIYRPGTGQWFIQGTTASVTSWGDTGDIPVPGDYGADASTDIAIYRPSTGQWFVRGGQVTSWGAGRDIPLPLPYAIQSVFFSQAGSPATTSTTSPATTSTTAAPTTTTTAAPTTTTTAPTTTTTAAPSTTTTSIPPATVPGIPPVTVAGV